MKGTGFVRKMDELGRIVIPMEFRRSFNWDAGAAIEIFMDDEGIYLRKYQAGCIFCGEANKTEKIKGKDVCLNCCSDLLESNSWK